MPDPEDDQTPDAGPENQPEAGAVDELEELIDGACEISDDELVEETKDQPKRKRKAKAKKVPKAEKWLRTGTDLYLADRFVKHRQDVIRYCAKLKAWFIWNGKIWQQDDDERICDLARETLMQVTEVYLREAAKAQEKVDEWAESEDAKKMDKKDFNRELAAKQKKVNRWHREIEKIQDKQKIDRFLRWAQTDRRVLIEQGEFDRNPFLLTCETGIIDLRTGELGDHDPDEFCTRMSPVSYKSRDPDLKDCRWALDKILDHISGGDPKVARFIQYSLGNSIFGHNSLELFYIAQSEGRSGKGTLFNAIQSVLGEDVMTFAEAKSFVKEKGYRTRDDLARLRGARIVMVSESNKGDQMDTALIKGLSGNDPYVARQLYERLSQALVTFTIWMQTNEMPWIDPKDKAARERLVVIPMGKMVPRKDRDPEVKRRLADPEDGGKALLHWLVEGAVKTHGAKTIEMPDPIKEANGRYWSDADRNQDFFYDVLRFVRLGKDEWEETICACSDITAAYRAWADEHDIPKWSRLSKEDLAARLEDLGCDRSKRKRFPSANDRKAKNTPAWRGVTIADDYYAAACKENGDRVTFMPKHEASEEFLMEVYPRTRLEQCNTDGDVSPDDDSMCQSSVPNAAGDSSLTGAGAHAHPPAGARGESPDGPTGTEQRNTGPDPGPPGGGGVSLDFDDPDPF